MSVTLLVILGLFALAIIIVAVAKIGPDAFVRLWLSLPIRLRSIVNVGVAAALAFGGAQVLDLIAHLDIPDWLKVGLTVVLTPIVRTLNSADDYPKPAPVTTGATGASGTQDG